LRNTASTRLEVLVLRHEYMQFAGALVNPQAELPAGIAAPPGVLAERFAVYRNNVFAGLIEALSGRFAITNMVVGDEFFRAMARTYVQHSRPGSAVLHEYGDDFPDCITTFPPAASLPWLADLARLEVLWSQSWGAADAPALTIDAFIGLTPEEVLSARIVPHPSVRMLRSSAPVADLWEAHQVSDPNLSAITWRAQDVLVSRPQVNVQLTRLSPGVAIFVQGLAAGETVELAAEAAVIEATGFEIGSALAGLINNGFAMELKRSCA
jgi:hypothetical protein